MCKYYMERINITGIIKYTIWPNIVVIFIIVITIVMSYLINNDNQNYSSTLSKLFKIFY